MAEEVIPQQTFGSASCFRNSLFFVSLFLVQQVVTFRLGWKTLFLFLQSQIRKDGVCFIST
jgi:hypothetical protein